MDNARIALVLREIADLLDIKGENPFRIRSYRLAADSVQNHGAEVAVMVKNGEDLKGLPGVGEGIAEKIRETVLQGDAGYHRELLAEVPGGLLELLEIPGLGPKGVSLVWQKLGVTGPDSLEAAIRDGRFRTLPGMKEKKEARILKGLEDRRRRATRHSLAEAGAALSALRSLLEGAGARRVEAAGSFRRGRESIGDLDLVVLGDGEKLSAALAESGDVKEVLGRGAAKTSVVLSSGLQVDLRPFDEESLGAALQYFTGSKAHNVALRERAVRLGLKVNEYGVYRQETGERLAGATEEGVYEAVGLPFIPPELREDRGEIEAALGGRLPRLVTAADLKGDLHSHTTESDGRESLAAMAEGARASGLSYLAITDHSRAIPSPTHGTGMDEKRCLAHIRRIREASERTEVRLLAGIEVDILPDGRLDMDDEVLAQLDVVVASLHSKLDMERGEMTDRVLRAFENSHVHVWGHPLARILFRREPVELDLDRVLSDAARRGIALEINGQPDRLDFPDHLVRSARDRGVRFVISSDAHSVKQLENRGWGLLQARRGWLEPGDVWTSLPVERFLDVRRGGGAKRS
jgi:DNA polymerase (family 10)